MDKRVCIACEIEYPLNEKYFGYAHGTHTRLLTKCRECVKEYQRQYREEKQEELGDGMYTIKEESLATKKHRMLKAFNYIHLQAFGEQMTENIYWCKKDEHVQMTTDVCPKCKKTMEKIGFVDYNEDDNK